MTNGRTFWAAGGWWKRCSAVCGITVTPCPLTVRRCASRRVEEHDHGRRRRPGRIHSPGSGGVSQNAGQMGTVRRPDRVLAAQLYSRFWRRIAKRRADGHRPPSGQGAGRATLPTRRLRERDRKRIGAGGDAPPDPAHQCAAVGHRSFAGLLPSGDRGSARPEGRSRLLPISAPQARTHRAPTVARQVIRHQPTMHAFGADDGKAPRTPAAWMILLVSLLPKKYAYGADDGPPTSRSRSQSRSQGGSLLPSTTGSLLPRAEGMRHPS